LIHHTVVGNVGLSSSTRWSKRSRQTWYQQHCIPYRYTKRIRKHNLIHTGSPADATSCHVHRQVVCYVVMYYSCFFYSMFQPYMVIFR
jgi:hypothetical protein